MSAVQLPPPQAQPLGAASGRRPGRWRVPRLVAAGLVLALAGFGVYIALLVHDVWAETMAGRTALNQGIAALGSGQPASLTPQRLAMAGADFQRAERSFARARSRLAIWGDIAADHGSLFPGPARQLQSVPPLLDLGRETALALTALTTALRPFGSVFDNAAPAAQQVSAGTPGGMSDGMLPRLTSTLESAQPALARAQTLLADARAERTRLAGLPLVAGAGALVATFDRRVPELAATLTYARALPDLLGAHMARSYLLVYQDTADLRATGGFIGSASLVILDQGRLVQIDYESSGDQPEGPSLQLPAALSGPPPYPLFYYRDLGSFQLRDANFWPDFPTSAAHIADLYRRLTGRHLDGVVALNPTAISYLLRGLGPLAIPGYGETVTSANAVQRIEYYVHDRPGAQADPHRKRFIIAVNHAVLMALLHAGYARLTAVLPAVESAFADRNIMVSVTDPIFAQALHRAHWDGALRQDGGDYLAVFDQNVTDSKLNPFIDQQINYDVTRRSDGGLDSRVAITYYNRTSHSTYWIARTYYQDYVRIAVPGASRLRDQVGYDDTFWPDEYESGRRLIPGGVLVPAGATRTISATYALPASTLAGGSAYTLVVQKQSGSRPALLSVRLHAGGKTWVAHTWLRRDTVFSIPWNAPAGDLRMHPASGAL